MPRAGHARATYPEPRLHALSTRARAAVTAPSPYPHATHAEGCFLIW
ncbi:hypothetical protein DA2_1171 [Desulfovibrio sp. A2]|nr:hypothetical protein DA2_1171 [Desulfovibrio sp. A2]